LREIRPEVEVETVEILNQPGRALQAGIWMIPALIIGERRFLRIPTLGELMEALDDATPPG
jgi:hypothetical protein